MHSSPAFCRSLVLCYIARWQPLRVRLVQGSHFTSWLLWLDRVNHWCPWNIDTALQFITLLDSNIQHVSCWKFGNLDVNWSSSCCVFWHNLIGLIRCQSSCLIAKNGLLKKQPSLNLIISWDLFGRVYMAKNMDVSVNDHRCVCVSPVIDWHNVPSISSFSPNVSWDRLWFHHLITC